MISTRLDVHSQRAIDTPGPNASGGNCRTQQRNTHSTESRVVRYRWHPWFGREVWVHQARQSPRPCGPVVRCGLTPDLDARSVEIALWMFDAAACRAMPMATAPMVTADALRELGILLEAVPHTKSGVPQQAEHLEPIASGGAHAHDCQAAASSDTIAALPAAPAGAVMGGAAPRTPAAGRTPASPHAPRARPATTRKGTASGGTR